MTKTLEELQDDVERMELIVYGIPVIIFMGLSLIGLAVILSKVLQV